MIHLPHKVVQRSHSDRGPRGRARLPPTTPLPAATFDHENVIPQKIAPPDQRPITVARPPIRHPRPDRRPATVSFRAQPRNLRRSSPPTLEAPAQPLRPPTGRPHFHERWRRWQPVWMIVTKISRSTPTSSCRPPSSYRGNPVPTVGRGGGYARHVQPQYDWQPPIFIPRAT